MKKYILLFIVALALGQTTKMYAQKNSPIPFLQRFYTQYIRSIDRMFEQDQRDSLVATALTQEAHEKVYRLVAATGVDPLLRMQDARAGLEKTFRAKQLKDGWYEVSLGEPAEQVRIPLHVTTVGGRYLIDFITPAWHGDAYGEHLRENPLAQSTSVDNSSEQAFILSFYRLYLSAYLSMSKDLGAILSGLRERYCTLTTIGLHHERSESGDMDDGYYDVLIDNVDFDPTWVSSLKIQPATQGGRYLISYMQTTGGQPIAHSILVSAVKNDFVEGYRLEVHKQDGAAPVPTPKPRITEEDARRMQHQYGDH